MTRRLSVERCCGILIDVQELFLRQLKKPERSRVENTTANLAGLWAYLGIPAVVTLERPVAEKGALLGCVARRLGPAAVFEKDFFDLTKERAIREHLLGIGRRQAIVAGSETDVCLLQSCLGLLDLGFEVFAVEEALFTSSRQAEAALARMAAEGVVISSYKTIYYELLEAVQISRHRKKIASRAGPLPKRLADSVDL